MKTKVLLTTVMALVLFTTPAFSQKGMGHNKGQRVGQAEQSLNLTVEQTYQLDTLRARFRRDMQIEGAQTRELRQAFMDELKKEKPSQKELDRLAKEIGKQAEKRQLLVAQHLQDTRKILTEEQYQQLIQLRCKNMQKMDARPHHKGKKGKGMGQGTVNQ